MTCVVSMLALVSCARTPMQLVATGPTMGTTYTVRVVAPPAGFDQAQLDALIDVVLAGIDATMSGYRPDSEVARFNAQRDTDWVSVSPALAQVVEYALQVSEQSGGAFDITVGPLVTAWGFGPRGEPFDLPDAQTLAQVRERVGYQHLQVRSEQPALRKLLPELQLDLNAIAPGYAVDQLGGLLRAAGVDHFMIDLGGEILAAGHGAHGAPWRIAVERPEDAIAQPYAVLNISDAAVTTSGEYRHYFDRDGQRYSHTIDPRTGRPVAHTLAAVVVVAPDSMQTDAWTTAFNVLGSQAGLALAQQLEMAVLFIERDGEELQSLMTPAFMPYLQAD